MDQLREVGGAIVLIDDRFQKISMNLWRFDRFRFRDENYNVVQLRPRWDQCHQRFAVALQESLQNAMAASDALREHGTLLQNKPKPEEASDLRRKLRTLVEIFKSHMNAMSASRESFQLLSNDVRQFATITEIEVQNASTPIPRELRSTRLSLRELDDRLQTVYLKLTCIGAACVSCIAISAASVGISIITQNPVAIAGAVLFGLGTITTGAGCERVKRPISTLEKEIQKYKAAASSTIIKQELLPGFARTREALKEDVSTVEAKIDVLWSIWQSFEADAWKLNEYLLLVVASRIPRLELLRNVHEALLVSLGEYAEIVGHASRYATNQTERSEEGPTVHHLREVLGDWRTDILLDLDYPRGAFATQRACRALRDSQRASAALARAIQHELVALPHVAKLLDDLSRRTITEPGRVSFGEKAAETIALSARTLSYETTTIDFARMLAEIARGLRLFQLVPDSDVPVRGLQALSTKVAILSEVRDLAVSDARRTADEVNSAIQSSSSPSVFMRRVRLASRVVRDLCGTHEELANILRGYAETHTDDTASARVE